MSCVSLQRTERMMVVVEVYVFRKVAVLPIGVPVCVTQTFTTYTSSRFQAISQEILGDYAVK